MGSISFEDANELVIEVICALKTVTSVWLQFEPPPGQSSVGPSAECTITNLVLI
jgi:hypothetical protein